MQRHADATLLPPPLLTSDADDSYNPASRRSLDEIGAVAVLKAMAASRPAAEEVEDIYAPRDDDDEDSDADATQPRKAAPRVPANSDAFLKAR